MALAYDEYLKMGGSAVPGTPTTTAPTSTTAIKPPTIAPLPTMGNDMLKLPEAGDLPSIPGMTPTTNAPALPQIQAAAPSGPTTSTAGIPNVTGGAAPTAAPMPAPNVMSIPIIGAAPSIGGDANQFAAASGQTLQPGTTGTVAPTSMDYTLRSGSPAPGTVAPAPGTTPLSGVTPIPGGTTGPVLSPVENMPPPGTGTQLPGADPAEEAYIQPRPTQYTAPSFEEQFRNSPTYLAGQAMKEGLGYSHEQPGEADYPGANEPTPDEVAQQENESSEVPTDTSGPGWQDVTDQEWDEMNQQNPALFPRPNYDIRPPSGGTGTPGTGGPYSPTDTSGPGWQDVTDQEWDEMNQQNPDLFRPDAGDRQPLPNTTQSPGQGYQPGFFNPTNFGSGGPWANPTDGGGGGGGTGGGSSSYSYDKSNQFSNPLHTFDPQNAEQYVSNIGKVPLPGDLRYSGMMGREAQNPLVMGNVGREAAPQREYTQQMAREAANEANAMLSQGLNTRMDALAGAAGGRGMGQGGSAGRLQDQARMETLGQQSQNVRQALEGAAKYGDEFNRDIFGQNIAQRGQDTQFLSQLNDALNQRAGLGVQQRGQDVGFMSDVNQQALALSGQGLQQRGQDIDQQQIVASIVNNLLGQQQSGGQKMGESWSQGMNAYSGGGGGGDEDPYGQLDYLNPFF